MLWGSYVAVLVQLYNFNCTWNQVCALDVYFSLIDTVSSSWASVEISGHDSTALHGQDYTLVCTVTVIEGITLPVTIEWLHSNGSAVANERIVIQNNTVSLITTLTMTFTPVLTTDGGDYSCRATINVPWMDEQPPPRTARVHIPVTSKATFHCGYDIIIASCFLFYSSSNISVNDGSCSILCELECTLHYLKNNFIPTCIIIGWTEPSAWAGYQTKLGSCCS